MTAFFPTVDGVLDDHVESWFLCYAQPPREQPEGMESVVNLAASREWLVQPGEDGVARVGVEDGMRGRRGVAAHDQPARSAADTGGDEDE